MSDRSEDMLFDGILSAYQLRARITDRMRYCGPWHDRDPQAPAGTAWFHLLDRGACELRYPGSEAPVRMQDGDFAVFTRGSAHRLDHAPDWSRGEDTTTMLCGELRFENAAGQRLLEGLPELILVRSADAGDTFRRIIELLAAEAVMPGFGSQAVMDRLADALFVMSLRHHLAQHPAQRGLFAALADPRLRRALDAMHARPGDDWTVARLAEVACCSRTVFAERFVEVMGESPIQYLTHWRMIQATKLLRDPRLSVAQVAGMLGYGTEAAFRRSFARVLGYGPGAFRRGLAGIDEADGILESP